MNIVIGTETKCPKCSGEIILTIAGWKCLNCDIVFDAEYDIVQDNVDGVNVQCVLCGEKLEEDALVKAMNDMELCSGCTDSWLQFSMKKIHGKESYVTGVGKE